jgi:hypothetical protein
MPWRVPKHRETNTVLNVIHMWAMTLGNYGASRQLVPEREMLEDVVKQRDNLLEYIAKVQPMDWQIFKSAMDQSGVFGAAVQTGISKNPHDFLRAVLSPVGHPDQTLKALFRPENTWAILYYLDEVLRREGISDDGLSAGATIQEDKEVHSLMPGDSAAIPETTRPHRPR